MAFEAARRATEVQTPIIPVVGDWIRNNRDVISLGQGIVHYPPPQAVFERPATWSDDPLMHSYGSVSGTQELRDALRRKLRLENGIRADGEQTEVVVTAGANMGFMNAILAVTSPGDEVILLSPYYFNHEMAVRLAGCLPVIVATDEDYQPVVDRIRRSISPLTRAVVSISPNNPTGAVYPRDTLAEINLLCAENGLFHIHDEAYEYFVYEGVEHVSPGAFEGAAPHTVSIYSLSKAYGFAAWRIGYMVIPMVLLESVRKIQDTILICPPIICQQAAVAALEVGKAYCAPFVRELAGVRKLVTGALAALGGMVHTPVPGGAFYVLAKVNTARDDLEITRTLIERFGVAVIPGSAFGVTGGCYLRIAYGALNRESVEEAMARLVAGLRHICRQET